LGLLGSGTGIKVYFENIYYRKYRLLIKPPPNISGAMMLLKAKCGGNLCNGVGSHEDVV
jgi:hypothetical protein